MQTLFAILLVALIILGSVWVFGYNPYKPDGAYQNINVKEFDELKNDPKTIVLDVRTAREYNESHIEDAEHIDVLEPDFLTKVRRLDPNRMYLLYCRSGSRSRRAANLMSQAGFEHLFNLKGGYNAWARKH